MRKFTITDERLAALEEFYHPVNVMRMLEDFHNIEEYLLDSDHTEESEEEMRNSLYILATLRDIRKHLQAMTKGGDE